MWSDNTTDTTPGQFNLLMLIKKTISTDRERQYVKQQIKSVLRELPFLPKKAAVKLLCTDVSYRHRYLYAVQFWRDKTNNCSETITKDEASDFIAELESELNCTERLYPEQDLADGREIFRSDSFFQFKRSESKSHSHEKSTWYVTCKSENKFYVKSANEDEVEIEKEDIPCRYELICVGDEVEVISPATAASKPSVNLTKSSGLAEKPNAKAQFIQDLLDRFSQGGSITGIYNILCVRCEGIWDYIKNDADMFQNDVHIKAVTKLSTLLSKNLLMKSKKWLCRKFCENVSASYCFGSALPSYIEANANQLSSKEIHEMQSLLELMMEIVPHTARNIFKVAEHLANAMHVKNNEASNTEYRSKCSGVKFMAKIGQILAKSVKGSESVDTTNCEWHELPTIPTENEILNDFDLKSLEAIKRDKPYKSTEQYLEINYKLLREECFRNLCTGIQDFLKGKSYDGRKMKMYRTTLKSVYGGSVVELNCKNYYEEQKKDSEESEDTSNDVILYGSLMCISLNKKFDAVIWATFVKSETTPNTKTKIVHARLCSHRNNMETIDVVLELLTLMNEGDHALMAESPTFFQAFGPSMDCLKDMKEMDMPLKNELVFAKTSDPPQYTQDKEQTCDWSIIFDQPSGCEFTFPRDEQLSPIEQYKHLKATIEMSRRLLDRTQMLAIENFLENKVSLIQGPPGTGKSFLGEKILRLMLSMEIQKRYKGPILVMTYKNFALDHFLESCLKYTKNIVRIGKAGNENLAGINLRNVRSREGIRDELKAHDWKAREKMRKFGSELESLFKCLSNPIFTLQSFFEAASEYHIRSLLTFSPNKNGNISDDVADDLISSWKKGRIPVELKELVKQSLNEWLPKTYIKEKYGDCRRNQPDPVHCGKKRVLKSVSQDNEESSDDARDDKVVAQERQQEAIEDDCEDTPTNTEHIADVEPLAKDTHIPFLCKNDKDAWNDVDDESNLWDMDEKERVDFIRGLGSKIVRRFRKAVEEYEDSAQEHQEYLDDGTVELLKKFDVIGMTVTGASTRLHLLNQLNPCAVIIEEAAEIIEGQLVSVLPPTIQHLVMLGDQEQLRPPISCYRLKKEKNLDCSMFERLINNKMPFQQLGQQCRMREDIAELLRSLRIYEDLETNHKETYLNVPPQCIGTSLFFVKHSRPEKQMQGTKSMYNQKEINDILEVAEYLLRNGYPPGKITVLCPYRGQVQKMQDAFDQKRKSSQPSEDYFTKLKDIYITTVDSFQGDENDVILLSLVRSNKDMRIGFFAERNRICVAISRARCGLYMFGDISVYSKSRNWREIIDFLEKKHLVGSKFPFKDDYDGVTLEKVEEEFCDTTKLFSREIELLSEGIVCDWQRLAGLAKLRRGEIDNLSIDHVNYPQPINKAARILSIISEKRDFSRERLGEHLEEIGKVHLKEIIGLLEEKHLVGTKSPFKDDHYGITLDEVENEEFCDTTKLSSPERQRLAQELVCDHHWLDIARLANIPEGEIENVNSNLNYPTPISKAAKMLAVINEKPNFSRKRLGEHLEEVERVDLKEKVLQGTLRDSAGPDVSLSSSASIN